MLEVGAGSVTNSIAIGSCMIPSIMSFLSRSCRGSSFHLFRVLHFPGTCQKMVFPVVFVVGQSPENLGLVVLRVREFQKSGLCLELSFSVSKGFIGDNTGSFSGGP